MLCIWSPLALASCVPGRSRPISFSVRLATPLWCPRSGVIRSGIGRAVRQQSSEASQWGPHRACSPDPERPGGEAPTGSCRAYRHSHALMRCPTGESGPHKAMPIGAEDRPVTRQTQEPIAVPPSPLRHPLVKLKDSQATGTQHCYSSLSERGGTGLERYGTRWVRRRNAPQPEPPKGGRRTS